MAYVDSINKNNSQTFNTLFAFNHTFINTQSIDTTKTITFPIGYDVTDLTGQTNISFKVVFVNGHNCVDASTPMTLNGIAVVSNQNGILAPLPIYNMSGTYKSLQPNTCLEFYYTSDYDGDNTPAYVVIGNPVVLSSSDYTIYADGYHINSRVSTIDLGVNGSIWVS